MIFNLMAPIVKLVTFQSSHIKTMIDTLNCLVSDCNITFHPKSSNKFGGVSIKELNKTQSILIHCKLDANQFDHFEYNSDKDSITIGINLSNLLKCLKCMCNADSMTWIIDDNDINKLVMILEHKMEIKKFSINLMDLDYTDYNIDQVDFPYRFNALTQHFQRWCKDMAGCSDKLDLKVTEDYVQFGGTGDASDFEFTIPHCKDPNNPEGLFITKNFEMDVEMVQGLFEVKYLSIFTKCTSLSERLNVFLNNEYPLIIEYPVASLGLLKLVLSPSKPSDLY